MWEEDAAVVDVSRMLADDAGYFQQQSKRQEQWQFAGGLSVKTLRDHLGDLLGGHSMVQKAA